MTTRGLEEKDCTQLATLIHRAVELGKKINVKKLVEFKDKVDAYFEEGNNEQQYGSTQGFARKWGWYSSIYGLSKGDVSKYDSITKLNVHQCLMFLAFEKEKTQIEMQRIKSKQR